MTQEPNQDSQATRRGVLAGVGLVGLAGAITACGTSGSSSSPATGTDPTSTPAAGATTASVPAASSSGGASSALTSTSKVPVGGGAIIPAELVVVTQPTAGEYRAFSAVCTHLGCTVSTISDGIIQCPCHGSEYSIKNGAVVRGPAVKPLPAKRIKVDGDSIFLE